MTDANPDYTLEQAEFWRARDASVDRNSHPAGRTGARLFDINIGAGSWSVPPVPELVLFFPKTLNADMDLDFSAGRFQAKVQLNSVAIKPPLIVSVEEIHTQQELKSLVVPYENLLALAGDDSGLPGDGDFGSVHAGLHIDPEINVRIDRLWSDMESGNPRGALFADSMLLHIAARLLEIRDAPDVAPRLIVGGLAPWQIKRVCEAMIAALDADVEESSLADLALMIGLSANHFCYGFAQSMGMPPHRWMTQQRMDRASVLLKDHNLSLTEIAIALGYTSQSAFGRAFARVTGVTPSVRRRELLS